MTKYVARQKPHAPKGEFKCVPYEEERAKERELSKMTFPKLYYEPQGYVNIVAVLMGREEP